MVVIQSVAAEIRRGKKRKKKKIEDRKKLQGKNIMAPLLHRAAIIIIIIHSFLYRHKVVTSENYYFNTTRHFCLDLSVSTRDLHQKKLIQFFFQFLPWCGKKLVVCMA